MTQDPDAGDRINAVISGPVQGAVAVGKDIAQHQEVGQMEIGLSDAERTELAAVFAELREKVAAAVPEGERPAALSGLASSSRRSRRSNPI
jgi:hypothetical protein